jgi:hypothetical protein
MSAPSSASASKASSRSSLGQYTMISMILNTSRAPLPAGAKPAF